MNLLKKAPLLGRVVNVFSRIDDHDGQSIGATLEITTLFPCPVACKICPQETWKQAYKGKRRLTFADFCQLLEKIPQHVRLDFSGFSEPFLNRESSRMMRHAWEQGYRVALYTTLMGFTRNDLDTLGDIRFAACTVHIPDDTNFTVPDETRWIETFRLFAQNIPYDNAIYHMGKISPRLKREISRICRPPILTRANTVDEGIVKPLSRRKGAIRCSISGNLFHQNVMMPNGDVYLCCMDWSLKHKLGNLFEQVYDDLYASEEYRQVCHSMTDPAIESICRYCERSISDH